VKVERGGGGGGGGGGGSGGGREAEGNGARKSEEKEEGRLMQGYVLGKQANAMNEVDYGSEAAAAAAVAAEEEEESLLTVHGGGLGGRGRAYVTVRAVSALHLLAGMKRVRCVLAALVSRL